MLSELAILFQLKTTPAITVAATPTVPPTAVRRVPAGPTSLRDLATKTKLKKDVAWPSSSKKAGGTPVPAQEGPKPAGPSTVESPPPSESATALDRAAADLVRASKASRKNPGASSEEYKDAKDAFEAARRACAEDPSCLNPLREQRLSDKLTMADEQAFRDAVIRYLQASGTYSQGNVDALMKAWRQE